MSGDTEREAWNGMGGKYRAERGISMGKEDGKGKREMEGLASPK